MDCGVIPPGIPEWVRVEESVCQYWIAIINHQYELAKYYCVPDRVWYNKTDEWEEYINTNSEGEVLVLIYLLSFYKLTEVIGDNTILGFDIF